MRPLTVDVNTAPHGTTANPPLWGDEAVLAEQFDAMVWIEQTQPVTALPLPKSQTLEPEDETFPFGV